MKIAYTEVEYTGKTLFFQDGGAILSAMRTFEEAAGTGRGFPYDKGEDYDRIPQPECLPRNVAFFEEFQIHDVVRRNWKN